MKKVEFRAWDLKDKRMYHNVGIVGTLIILEHEQGGYEFCELELKSYDHIDNNYELMRYTGLKDKSGKKIFEGDIVKTSIEEGDIITQVVFKDFGWKEKLISSPLNHLRDYFPFSGDISIVTEVIGNIYENQNIIK
ncbi:hypothetical protein CN448_31105 [Bacillus cereus]|uniref:YopX family protein n=1 Tax=Bacillus cereus TaxID=1396 RepID=UPI000BF27578|nr:YopX family protein [Bacillus cereus]PEW59815.1 hypothetical protein CN448_31105 [Bacillus cereus]